jgi:condensin complex subunit 1
MGELDPEPYMQKLSELYDFVKANLPENIKDAHEAAKKEAIENGDDDETMMQLEQATLAAAIDEANNMDCSEELNSQDNKFRAKVEALKFAQSALEFIDQFECASTALHSMLLSSNTSDVTEALRFFVRARHFKLPCAVTGMRQALSLMWSNEQNIKDEVLKAFVDVFIALPGSGGSETLPNKQIAYNLLVLAEHATVSELASIEEAIGLLVKDERIPADVFSILWSATSKGSSRPTAIHVLSMAASADRSIVDSKSRLKLLLDVALGDYTEEHKDWKTARAASFALQRCERAQVNSSCAKYLVLERIMEQLCAVARGDWCVDSNERDTLEWFSAAEQAVSALFVICPEPEVACAEIIRGMHMQTLGGSEDDKCSPLRLARFFHVLGHIALKLLVYTEALSGSVRRANAKKSLKKQEEADKVKANTGDGDQIEAELGMAAEVEAENERKVTEIAEKEIVGRGLISMFAPLLVRVVSNEGGRFKSEVLLQTSTLALCKFMCVSSSFCEKHLPVLFTALANAPDRDTTMRANTVVALGDLAFRFPNEVEPYTPRLYACLRDNSTKVRRHTLMVLTHLILNDMVKVKGQVCEIALCLRDKDQRMRDMSRLLFHELSKRSNNPVYNLLPDIISQLSQVSISKEDFRSILSFLLGYIKKEKQNEMLIDKLCQRFPKCTSISQKADIAFCIGQLKVNERSIKCLSENFKLYKDALFDEEVKKSFSSIVSKAKKSAKPELKQTIEEWETKLSEQAELAGENELAGDKASKAKTRASKRSKKQPKKRLETMKEWSDEEGEEEGEVESDAEDKETDAEDKENSLVRPTRTPQKGRSARQARGNALHM